jgi:hypothetical protein
MANIIKPKRSNTAAKVPNTTELTSGELGVNMADLKVYINNGTSVVQVGAGNLSGLGDVAIASPTNGQGLTYNSTTGKWVNAATGSGTVTSVGITPGTGVTVSNSPITTSGNIAVGLSTKLTAIENLSGAGFITQNGSGAIAGRTLQAGTGISIANGNGSSQDPVITNSAPDQTVALTGGGATSISGTYPNFTISSVNTTYGAATSTVPGLIELGSDTAQTVAANAVSATASRSYALQVNAAGQGVVNVPWTDTNSGGTVTSVSGTGTASGLSLSGTVTTSGNLTLSGTVNSLAAGTYAISISGNAATATNVAYTGLTGTVPTWNQNTTGTAANVTGTVAVGNGGTGATTAAAARTNLGATTLGGNLFTLTNVAAIAFPRFNADNTISSLDAASFRTAIGAGTSNTTGTVTSVGGTGTVSGLSLSGTVTTSGNLTLGGTLAVTPSNFASQTANTILAAPNGSAGVPTFRAIVAADIPTLNQNTTGTAANVTGTVAIANGGTGATTRQNAMDALAGAVTSGQYLRGNGTDVVMSAIQAADVPTLNQNTTGTAAVSTAATVTTSSTASAFKVPFANTTASTTGNYGLLQDSTATFTYNPSTNTLTVGTVSGALSGNATTATTATNVSGGTANVTSLTVNSNNISAVNSLGFRNRMINGDMRIDQRNNGASVTPLDGQTTLDRWTAFRAQASKFSVQQNAGAVTPPTGFTNYAGVVSLSAYSSLSGDYFGFQQSIEGFNSADFQFGTAAAQTITVSFWVRSSLTGTFGGALRNSGNTRNFCFSYSVAAANTWEFKTITILGDTTGTWVTNNGLGIQVWFDLGSGSSLTGSPGSWGATQIIRPTGSVSLVGTNGATFYITGVQFEAGSVATPFERRDYGRELMMCQRYYAEVSATPTSASVYSYVFLPVTMRALPTVALKAGGLAGASYGAAPYGTNSIRQNTSASGAIDALLSTNAEF